MCPKGSPWFKLIVLALALVLIVPILVACGGSKKEGQLPTIKVGDKWTYELSHEGSSYSDTEEVTGQGNVNGRDCWIVKFSMTPAYMDISSGTLSFDKSSLLELESQGSGTTDGTPVSNTDVYSYQPSDASYYPLEVGKQVTIEQTHTQTTIVGDQTNTNTTTETYIYSVEAVEEITVPAGTFKCFRITDGNSTWWFSDKAKKSVKEIDEDGTTWVLKSYSV